ncbi:MAG: indole-3-glycerol phosphate synthase TrpC [Chloroflexi bacterium]|nr:indole-3-glycerol phosphate synthase TrpC [Chloroflexota bacterium]MCY3937910.1 indole-3-glycerol phosphate synthase TrpC [Chloroflexota bacterium]
MARTLTILDEIVVHKGAEVALASEATPQSLLMERAASLPRPRGFARALSTPGVSVIAEFKRASPSAGAFGTGLDPATTAREYEGGGAAALSVLTDARYFKGSAEDLDSARRAVALPVLRKDFVIDEYQIAESRVMGADAILLIAAVLDDMGDFSAAAHALGMDVLIEVHTEAELGRALDAEPDAIGINNRDLRTFHTDLAVTEGLVPQIPAGIPVVSESGIRGAEDVRALRDLGVDAVLVGESIVRSACRREAVSRLVEAGRV